MEWIEENIVFFEPKKVYYFKNLAGIKLGKVVVSETIYACMILGRLPVLDTMKTFETLDDAKQYIEELLNVKIMSNSMKYQLIDPKKQIQTYDENGQHLKTYYNLNTCLNGENMTVEEVVKFWIEFKEQVLHKRSSKRFFSHTFFTTLQKVLNYETRT